MFQWYFLHYIPLWIRLRNFIRENIGILNVIYCFLKRYGLEILNYEGNGWSLYTSV